MISISFVRSFAMLFIFMLLATQSVYSGPVYLNLVVDPPTTAFSGIPAAGGFNGISTRAGSGTWHLYAIDDTDNSFGIQFFFIRLKPGLGGAIPQVANRSPVTSWDDDSTFGGGNGPFYTGFLDVRSAPNNSNVSGAQLIRTGNPTIGGFGQTAGNFLAATGGQSFESTINGQWGNYADSPAVNFGSGLRYPLFLAEGTYTGPPPTIELPTPSPLSTRVFVWVTESFTDSDLAQLAIIPEPTSLLLAGYGVLAICGFKRIKT